MYSCAARLLQPHLLGVSLRLRVISASTTFFVVVVFSNEKFKREQKNTNCVSNTMFYTVPLISHLMNQPERMIVFSS